MSSSTPKRRRMLEIKPARRSARIQARNLTRIQSVQAGNSTVPALHMRDGKRKKGNEVVGPPSLQGDKFLKLEESLFLGISNDVTLAEIATRFPWGTFKTLSSGSPAWRQAMQDRLVYDGRVLAHSGDSCVLVSDTKSGLSFEWDLEDSTHAIFLYSLREYTCYRLPPIPQLQNGFPYDCECVALGGRVYVLGGTKTSSHKSQQLGSKDVYVLDLAGQGQWKSCARMQAARANFRCGTKDGKIYAFGGTCGKRWVRGSEVYDPNVDSWSVITPMGTWPPQDERNVDRRAVNRLWDCSLHNAVATGGEELVVLGGDLCLRGYYPATDTWKVLSDDFPLREEEFAVEFMAEGKLHSMSLDSIRVYDIEENKWTERYSCSFGPARHQLLWPISILAVDNEIVAIIDRNEGLDRCFGRSRGFGSDIEEIVWEVLPCSFPVGDRNPSMCFLKL